MSGCRSLTFSSLLAVIWLIFIISGFCIAFPCSFQTGHFNFAQTGHYNFAPTVLRQAKQLFGDGAIPAWVDGQPSPRHR